MKKLLFVLKHIKSQKGVILFVGLTKKDHSDYISFNEALKKLAVKEGHLYADSQFKSFLYNRWSPYKRRSNPSEYFLNLQKNNKLPSILFSFSKKIDDVIFKEFSKFGIPTVYTLECYGHSYFKDYPLIGTHSGKMLGFYLNMLKYSLKNVS